MGKQQKKLFFGFGLDLFGFDLGLFGFALGLFGFGFLFAVVVAGRVPIGLGLGIPLLVVLCLGI